jgi:hypothetical protein
MTKSSICVILYVPCSTYDSQRNSLERQRSLIFYGVISEYCKVFVRQSTICVTFCLWYGMVVKYKIPLLVKKDKYKSAAPPILVILEKISPE